MAADLSANGTNLTEVDQLKLQLKQCGEKLQAVSPVTSKLAGTVSTVHADQPVGRKQLSKISKKRLRIAQFNWPNVKRISVQSPEQPKLSKLEYTMLSTKQKRILFFLFEEPIKDVKSSEEHLTNIISSSNLSGKPQVQGELVDIRDNLTSVRTKLQTQKIKLLRPPQ